MTAIAGFTDGSRVWIGGDSSGISGYALTIRADRKVFRNGEFIFGFTSSFRMGQLLRYAFNPPAQKEHQDTAAYMSTDFVNAIRACLKEGGCARNNNEEESGGTFLVGYRGRLFRIDSDYQVGEPLSGYEACGCGEGVALGALYATAGMEPGKRIRIALEAAEQHNSNVRGPFHIEET